MKKNERPDYAANWGVRWRKAWPCGGRAFSARSSTRSTPEFARVPDDTSPTRPSFPPRARARDRDRKEGRIEHEHEHEHDYEEKRALAALVQCFAKVLQMIG